MEAHYHLGPPEEVANRVLRRVQVSKMTRALQDRLALANVKMQNGWENMSLDALEPKIEDNLRRKRPASSNDTTSDAASTTSSRIHSSRGLSSSPLTAPMFSDDLQTSGRDLKRVRSTQFSRPPLSGSATGRRARIVSQPWKTSHNLPESSPIKHSKHARFDSNNISFISETSTIADEPPSPDLSEEDDADLPVHSFSMHNTTTRINPTSPPRTPSPARRLRKTHNVSWSRTPKTGEEGADLLIYLATSPSANQTVKPTILPPTTPPCKSTPLPSSHMTPGTSGTGFLGFGPTTPGTNFNFADFVNVTPSPAQAPWSRTPIAGRTPGASARRKLNFDNLMPPSPTLTRNSKQGLAMELGGELVS
ncbi:hypothetical protein AMS68_005648 [Peltaster fructicola]|uniref:Uncharacterized protein n=1 Tax=Peltaster fructicola TaxID=286661 RepID=A0A6H0XZN8_9PEZI|nr:hypothetical protein AMS68_005648 [Peltaster fructicola]